MSELQLFESDIGLYTKEGLNNTLITVFGELSANLHAKSEQEARAIASTIFNRKSLIEKVRKQCTTSSTDTKAAQKAYDEATQEYESWTKNYSANLKKAGSKAAYDKKTEELQQKYNKAKAELKKAHILGIKICGTLTGRYQGYLPKARREEKVIKLTYIVEDESMYEGYPTGKRYFKDFPSMNKKDQERNRKRWSIARKVVEDLARRKKKRDKYIDFQAASITKEGHGGVTIGGNVFRGNYDEELEKMGVK